MDAAEKTLNDLIDHHLPSPTHMELAVSGNRVLDDLRSTPPHLRQARVNEIPRVVPVWRPMVSVAAAAVLLAAVVGAAIVWPRGARVYAAGDNGLQFTLADDSRVEMRAHSELTVDRAADGIRIDLKKGGIIVNATKQRSGHLYVQTREMTVTVVGTTFVVNAAEEGSRVSVIEGEVRVRDGALEQRLRPGEQVSTSPVLAARPIREEIAWSRHADAHLAILDSFTRGMAQTAGPLTPLARQADVAGAQTPGAQAAALEFEEASVRECDPDNLPPLPPGTRGGGANSVLSTPGRFYALCITPATLIRTAYGYRAVGMEALIPDPLPRGGRAPLRGRFGVVGSLGAEDGLRIRGGPDWVRNERYTIEAVASGTPDAATMSGPMLRALFARRFKLETHVETEQTTAFNLVVAPGGLKITPVASGACEVPVGKPGAPLLNGMPQGTPRSFADVRRGQKPTCGVWGGVNGPNWVSVAGEATLAQLTQMLRGLLTAGVGVTDKTGITDKFNWDLEYVLDGNVPQSRTTGVTDAAGIARAPTIFDALEQQLGLRLEPVQVPREHLVIDSIERPGPN